MSRSIRTRPTTLYSGDGRVPSDVPHAEGSAYARVAKKPPPVDAGQEDKVRNRLSTRYASGAMPALGSYSSNMSMLAPIAAVEEGDEGGEAAKPLHTLQSPAQASVPALAYLSPTPASSAVLGSARVASTSAFELGTPVLDQGVFATDQFDARTYVSSQLQHQNESGLRTMQGTLASIHDTTQKQLKTQVFKNYAGFITISKEIATLENDMLEFKDLLADWKQLPQQLQLQESLEPGGQPWPADGAGVLKGSRTATVDLDKMYKAQVSALWENIEGAQKFVPYLPGRHLVAETSQFVEVNAATYKPKQAVALFLLDDLLLIAVQRKGHYGSHAHLIAERCFGLSEIVVVDLKDGKELKNAIKIKRGKEAFVYHTEKAQDKRALLHAFRRVGEDLGNKLKRERRAKTEVQRTDGVLETDVLYLAPGDRPDASQDTDTTDLAPWLTTAVDELAVHIAVRRWDAAVALIEEGKQRMANRAVSSGPLDLLAEDFSACTNEVVLAISNELVSPYHRKTTVVHDAELLLRLDKGREARDLLLKARTDLLRRRTRQIKYEGDVSLYISELAMLYFTLIKNTGDWYMSAFKDYKMASGFVQWASDQVRAYAETFRRQVYGVDQRPEVVREAKEITMGCAKILDEVGLGLTFLLEYVITTNPANCSNQKTR